MMKHTLLEWLQSGIPFDEIYDNVYSGHDAPSLVWEEDSYISDYGINEFKELMDCEGTFKRINGYNCIILDFKDKDHEKLDEMRDRFLWSHCGYITDFLWNKMFKEEKE